MQINRIENMLGGWFIGDFIPSVFRTKYFEVCYKIHKKDEKWDVHYHKQALEINYLIRGRMLIQNHELVSGDIFTIFPGEISDPIFIEDCEVMVIKTPSVIGDKYQI